MKKSKFEEISSKLESLFPSNTVSDGTPKWEESLYNDATVKKWNEAAKSAEESYDPLEGNHIGINSEFFE